MTRKNTLFVAAALIAGSAPAMLSCSDQHDEITVEAGPADSFGLVGEELDKARYGCVYEDDEFADEDAATKVETRATDEYMAFLKGQNGPTLKSAYYRVPFVEPQENYVGVAKVTHCGGCQEFEVVFNSENRNPNSRITSANGKVIAWNVDGSGDVHMRFCRVPASKFDINSQFGYGLLMLSDFPLTNAYYDIRNERPLQYASVATCFMDAEDGSACWFDGISDSGFAPNVKDGNGNLVLKIFCMDKGYKTFGPMPDLGFPYGVFGRFGDRVHDVYFDCEDRNCSSDAYSQPVYVQDGYLYTYNDDCNLDDAQKEYIWEDGNMSFQISVVNYK